MQDQIPGRPTPVKQKHIKHTFSTDSQCGDHFYAVEGQPLLGFKVDKEPEMPIVTSSNHVESLFLKKKAHGISDAIGKEEIKWFV